jgi:hypothetical protein
MGVITYDMDVPCSVSAEKLFKAFILEGDSLIPKILPQAIKSIEILEGDGGAGSIKLLTFGESSQIKSVKQRVDGIDKENLTYSYSIIEGDILGDVIEAISYHIKIVPSEDGVGSICRNRSIYTCKEGANVNEDDIKAGKEKASGLFKAVEAYLAANPDA